ncbi:MAG: histidine kinase, partial [Roseiflexaceae bacterium]|nr:histidine kinase [Roseiflexaceae bacterium]
MVESTDKRLLQRESLLRISRALTQQLDTARVLELVIEVAVDLLAGTSGLIALPDPDGVMAVAAASALPA